MQTNWCIQSNSSFCNYCNKAEINEGIYVAKLKSHKLSLRIGCSIIPCIQSVRIACSYCINQQWMQAYMQSNQIDFWMQSNYLKFKDLPLLPTTKVFSVPSLKNPAYGRHRISRPMRIVGPIQFWRG